MDVTKFGNKCVFLEKLLTLLRVVKSFPSVWNALPRDTTFKTYFFGIHTLDSEECSICGSTLVWLCASPVESSTCGARESAQLTGEWIPVCKNVEIRVDNL